MKLVNYSSGGSTRVGILSGHRIFDVAMGAEKAGEQELSHVRTVDDILSHGHFSRLARLASEISGSVPGVEKDGVKIHSPVLNPGKIFLAAINYISHSKEQNVKPPKEPYFFTKFRNTIIGQGDPILLPKTSKKVDWEVELCAIIGKRGKYISASSAQEYIAGYTVSNDISFRDLQFPEGWPEKLSPLGQNWAKGKGLDNSLPLGPSLVTQDEIGSAYDLDISLSVNGQLRQSSNTRDMIFKVEDMIEYLSAGITLEPCDLISTGTPLGVAAFTGAPYLKGGDMVEARISKIGTLRNPVVAE